MTFNPFQFVFETNGFNEVKYVHEHCGSGNPCIGNFKRYKLLATSIDF